MTQYVSKSEGLVGIYHTAQVLSYGGVPLGMLTGSRVEERI